MKFKDLQLLEYGVKCIEEIINKTRNEDEQVTLQLVIKSSDDVFTASSLPEKVHGHYTSFNLLGGDMPFSAKPNRLISSFHDSNNPFTKVRHEAFKASVFFDISDTFLTSQPYLIIPQLTVLIKDIENTNEGEQFWFNYKSRLNDLDLKINYDIEDDYKVISLDYSENLVK